MKDHKSLNVIQKLFKLGKILSRIAFICALVGAGLCVVSLLCLALGNDAILRIGGAKLNGLNVDAVYGIEVAYTVMTGWLIVCAGEAVLAKFSENCFCCELNAGTPFDHAVAAQMKRLGVLCIALPIGCTILAAIVEGILSAILNVNADLALDFHLDRDGSVALGVMFIVTSLLCRFGADREAELRSEESPRLLEEERHADA